MSVEDKMINIPSPLPHPAAMRSSAVVEGDYVPLAQVRTPPTSGHGRPDEKSSVRTTVDDGRHRRTEQALRHVRPEVRRPDASG